MTNASRAPWRPRHSVALLLLVLVALALLVPFGGYLTDDTFIHLQFAKHLIRGEGFAFNSGEPTYGATSPLWVLLLAGAGSRIPGAGTTPSSPAALPVLAAVAKGWGALAAAAAVLLAAALGRAIGWGPRWALAAAAMVALDAWATRWAFSGMETPLALALTLLSLLLLARALIQRKGTFPAGLALGAAFLVRPEFLLLFVLALVAVWRGSEPRHRAGRIVALAVGAALTAGPWLAVAFTWFHRLLPNTGAAKAGAWLDPGRAISAVRESIRALIAADFVPLAIAIGALAWMRPWQAMGTNGRRAFWALVFAWPVLLVLGFAVQGVQVVSRYLVPVMPSVVLIGLAALAHATERFAPRRRAVALAAVLALFAVQNLIVTFALSVPHARRHTEGLHGSLASLGVWARETTSPRTLFAVADIGAFGYYSDRPVLDLYGLVTPRMASATVRDGYDAVVWNFLYEPVGRPAYLIDRSDRPGRLMPPDDPTNPYRFLFARSIPDLGITRPNPYYYSVYEIDWSVYDRLHPRVAQE